MAYLGTKKDHCGWRSDNQAGGDRQNGDWKLKHGRTSSLWPIYSVRQQIFTELLLSAKHFGLCPKSSQSLKGFKQRSFMRTLCCERWSAHMVAGTLGMGTRMRWPQNSPCKKWWWLRLQGQQWKLTETDANERRRGLGSSRWDLDPGDWAGLLEIMSLAWDIFLNYWFVSSIHRKAIHGFTARGRI